MPLKRILIVGGGAAGMSCAATLANNPSKFTVTLIERESFVGGQATSASLDPDRYGADFLNDGVQGGSEIFAHTFRFFKMMGYEATEVKLQISFGKGKDGFWSNVFPSHLVQEFQSDIKKFGKVLKVVHYLEIVFALVPVWLLLRIFFFSKGFGDKMVYPLMALFLGTGNQTPHVSSAILERLFLDPNMKLWDYSDKTLLPNLPKMFTFPKLGDFYAAWANKLRKQGVEIRTGHEISSILSRSSTGVVVQTRPTGAEGDEIIETYDELVLAVLADDAKRLLGSKARWMEKNVLGSAKFFDDITVTHNDLEYFEKYYETRFKDELVMRDVREKEQKEQVEFAKKDFAPMYYTHSYEKDPKRIEMSFDWYHPFPKDLPLDRHVFQTILYPSPPSPLTWCSLDNSHNDLWTREEINKDKIILEKWWHQLGHNWTHYCKVVPWMMFLQGKQHTWFAGSWTLVNMHELAVVSGMSVACRLGAEYPFPKEEEKFGFSFFKTYMLLNHGVRYKERK